MDAEIKKALRQIARLKKKVPEDWATQIGKEMGKDARTIRAYSIGTRGIRDGMYLTVLEHLQDMVNERRERIQELTA